MSDTRSPRCTKRGMSCSISVVLPLPDQPAKPKSLHLGFRQGGNHDRAGEDPDRRRRRAVAGVVTAKLAERYDIVSTKVPGNVLKLARETKPDLIICDFDMPEMDGSELSAALLADEELRHIPLLFLTALADRRPESHAQADRRAPGDLEGRAARPAH